MQKRLPVAPGDGAVDSPGSAPSRLLALIPGALAFVLYLVTSSPTINFTDSGELVTVAWTGGIAHPPGYPLFTLFGILFSQIPFGEPAWRINILSALFGAVAVSFFYVLVTDTLMRMAGLQREEGQRSGRSRGAAIDRYKSSPTSRRGRTTSGAHPAKETEANSRAPREKSRATPAVSTKGSAAQNEVGESGGEMTMWIAVAGGMAAAGLLAVSLTFWNWATQAKFYTLHFAFAAVIIWLALLARRALAKGGVTGAASGPRWSPRGWPPAIRLLHLLAFVIGLSLTNHFLTFLLLPGIGVLLLTPMRHAWERVRQVMRYAGTLVAAGLLPLLVYLYLPIRANMNPLIEWGTPDNWNNFWRHVTARSYQDLFGGGSAGTKLVDGAIYAANQFGPWMGVLLLVPIVVGIGNLWRTERGVLAATVVIALTHVLVVLNYNIREVVTYYVPLYMVLLWWAGLGVSRIIVWIHRMLSEEATTPAGTTQGTSTSSAQVSRTTEIAITLALGAALPLAGLFVNWGAAGHRVNYTAELYVRNAFKNFRPNAVVITNYWDLTSASFYLQRVLNERQDVVIIDKSMLRQPFYLQYLESTHPDLAGKVAQPMAQYKALLREWVDTGRTPQALQGSYLNLLNAIIDTNLGERPMYTVFVAAANDVLERQEIQALYENREIQFVPDGLASRIEPAGAEADLSTRDPQFDLRGITSERVPLDEIEAATIALYGPAMQDIGAYMQNSPTPEDKEVGARLLAQAQELQPFVPLKDARPRLR